jgi:hypothetical protein
VASDAPIAAVLDRRRLRELAGVALMRGVRLSPPGIWACGGIELLCLACQALDRAESLSEAIAAEGQTICTRIGGIRAHPALRDELANRALVARLLSKLGINVDVPGGAMIVGRTK